MRANYLDGASKREAVIGPFFLLERNREKKRNKKRGYWPNGVQAGALWAIGRELPAKRCATAFSPVVGE